MSASGTSIGSLLSSGGSRAEQLSRVLRDSVVLAEAPPDDVFPPLYQPSAKQRLLHDATATHVLYGGAAGGGKSWGLIADAIAFCRRWPRVNVCFLRRTYGELEETIIERFVQTCPPGWMRYNATQHTARFTNGSVIWFRHANHEADLTRRQGPEYQAIYFDELTHFTAPMYDFLSTRLRLLDGRQVPLHIKSASNPGGPGHGWVRTRFIDATTRPKDHEFIPATLADNPGDTEAYRASLEALPDANLRDALLHGNWDRFAGQYFTLWDPALHVCDPFEIPASWPRVRGFDYGGTAPFVCIWMALDPSCEPARVYVYREYHRAGASLQENVEAALRLSEGETYRASLADPSMFAKTQEEGRRRVSLAEQAARLGLKLKPAANDRVPGWALMKEQMAVQPDGLPGLIWFRSCVSSTTTLPTLVYDPRNPEDLDTGGDDHDADATRYGLPGLVVRRTAARPTVGRARTAIAAGSPYRDV